MGCFWVGVQGLIWDETGCNAAPFALRVEGGHRGWGRRAPGGVVVILLLLGVSRAPGFILAAWVLLD